MASLIKIVLFLRVFARFGTFYPFFGELECKCTFLEHPIGIIDVQDNMPFVKSLSAGPQCTMRLLCSSESFSFRSR
jgi:hypothetical protein